jgi:PAS domain-containing protein
MGERSATFDAGQCAILELVALGAPLSETLDAIVRLIESQAEGMTCSVLLLDAERRRVRHVAAPNLPPTYTKVLDGAPIGPEAGSCGAAAHRGQRVIVEDIATHPYWAPYRDLVLPHGLHACWSSPIFSTDRKVLGTFAMYYEESRGPRAEEIVWVDSATHLASVAISRDSVEREWRSAALELRRSEERLRAVIENTPNVAIQWYDEDGRILFYNKTSERLFGWTSTPVIGKTLGELGFLDRDEEARIACATPPSI